MVFFCEYYIEYFFLCFFIVLVVYNEWFFWNWCLVFCGIIGVWNRICGCYSILFGFVNFNGKCDIGGEEKESCVGVCLYIIIVVILYLGIYGYIYMYLGIVMKFIMLIKCMLFWWLFVCIKVFIFWIYDICVLYDVYFFL